MRRSHEARAVILIATAIAAGASSAGWACGAYVDDKVAATYDHAFIDTAIAKHQQVVFVAVGGPISAEKIGARIMAVASKIRGVQTGTLRESQCQNGLLSPSTWTRSKVTRSTSNAIGIKLLI